MYSISTSVAEWYKASVVRRFFGTDVGSIPAAGKRTVLGLLKLDDREGIVGVGINSHSLDHVLPRVCVVNA